MLRKQKQQAHTLTSLAAAGLLTLGLSGAAQAAQPGVGITAQPIDFGNQNTLRLGLRWSI